MKQQKVKGRRGKLEEKAVWQMNTSWYLLGYGREHLRLGSKDNWAF